MKIQLRTFHQEMTSVLPIPPEQVKILVEKFKEAEAVGEGIELEITITVPMPEGKPWMGGQR